MTFSFKPSVSFIQRAFPRLCRCSHAHFSYIFFSFLLHFQWFYSNHWKYFNFFYKSCFFFTFVSIFFFFGKMEIKKFPFVFLCSRKPFRAKWKRQAIPFVMPNLDTPGDLIFHLFFMEPLHLAFSLSFLPRWPFLFCPRGLRVNNYTLVFSIRRSEGLSWHRRSPCCCFQKERFLNDSSIIANAHFLPVFAPILSSHLHSFNPLFFFPNHDIINLLFTLIYSTKLIQSLESLNNVDFFYFGE